MRLDDAPESSNVEDSRGMGTKVAVGGGGLLILILGLIFGPDFIRDANVNPPMQQGAPPDQKTLVLVRKILGTTEEVWNEEFRKMGRRYTPPHLELFSEQVRTGCGVAPSEVGPFYCPRDQKVYLDPTFFEELERKLGGSRSEFSQAYVIAHEVGHHVQNQLGYMDLGDSGHDKDFSVRLELQADYLAGVWAHQGQKRFNFIEPGEAATAIQTANAIGDDRLQRRAGGFVHPEKFTHGTSAQRVHWFTDGLKTGDASKKKLDYFFNVRSSREL